MTRETDKEAFLERWSRRKVEQAEEKAALPAQSQEKDEPVVALPPIEDLNAESDFTPFMNPRVDGETRRAALKKLFSDPSFNVMDGLDIYVGDYTQSDPMPAGMLEKLSAVYAMLDPVPLPVEDKDVDGDGATDKRVATSATTEAEPVPVGTATLPLPLGDAAVPATDEAESAPGAHDQAQTKRQ